MQLYESKSFDITEKDVEEIKGLNARINVIKNLLKEFSTNDSSDAYERLINDLAKTQILYEAWFDKKQKEFGAIVSSSQRWNVDFDNKKLEII